MVQDHRFELLKLAYEQERQEERQFWTQTITYYVAAITALSAVVITAGDRAPWGTWILAPVLTAALMSFYVQQGAIGGRRRLYMNALELALSNGQGSVAVEGGPSIRPLANNSLTWYFTTVETKRTRPAAIFLFVLVNLFPIVLSGTIVVASIYHLAHGHHVAAAWFTSVLIGCMIVTLVTTLALTWSPKSMTDSFSRVPEVL